ncbi:MAG: four helix bundle protein [Bacteroidales bacterium]|nr:four helix bundle protein [Bacteroidales bacterium]
METTTTERIPTFFRFEDLRIYHKALEYIAWVHKATTSFPDTPHDNAGVRYNEAARSIAFHVAEGSARNKSQFIYYLKMAKSAIREALVLTSIVKSFDYLSDKQEEESRNYLMELTKMIGALISSLQRTSSGSNEADDDDDREPPRHQFRPDGNY